MAFADPRVMLVIQFGLDYLNSKSVWEYLDNALYSCIYLIQNPMSYWRFSFKLVTRKICYVWENPFVAIFGCRLSIKMK